MRRMIVKRLFVYLVVVAFIGAPWAQAFAQSHVHDCAVSAMTAAGDLALHEAELGDIAHHKTKPAKEMSVGCVKNCAAPLNITVPSASWSFEGWMQVYEPAARAALDGRNLEPELSPPIGLV